MTRLTLVGTLLVALLVPLAPRAATDDLATFLTWNEAVLTHTPGQPDAAVHFVWTMQPADRDAVNGKLPDFLATMAQPLRDVPDSANQPPPSQSNPAVAANMNLIVNARAAARKVTPTGYLERAAMLHADAVMFDRRPPKPEPSHVDARPTPMARTGALVSQPPESSTDSGYITMVDGEVTGVIPRNWNWKFARTLLDRIKPIPTTDPFVAAWYHGTTSYLMRHGDFGEVREHLDHGATLLPDNARLLFDRGTLDESLAMNLFQQVMVDDRAQQIFAGGRGIAVGSRYKANVEVPDPAQSNARAKQDYEHAIAVNPALVEAHARLARVLEIDGDFAGALAQVESALALDPPSEIAFYAHLFGARAANALGRNDEAEGHAQAALKLYPTASSALLAASQTAMHRADPGTAVDDLNRLNSEPVNGAADTLEDPWQRYVDGAGRSAELALTELWAIVPAVAGRTPEAAAAPAPDVKAVLTAAPAVVQASQDPVEKFVMWSRAIITHTPGRTDDAVKTVWAMRSPDRDSDLALLKGYLRVLSAIEAGVSMIDFRKNGPSVDPRIADAALNASKRVTVRAFLERGAMLHADAVMFDRRSDAQRMFDDPPPSPVLAAPPRPGLSLHPADQAQQDADSVTLSDGEVTGTVGANPNWLFARVLLDSLKAIPPDDAFVAAWYHGAASYLLRRGNFAEAVPLLDHAGEILPNDARLLFDRGTVEESFAMGMLQQASNQADDDPTARLSLNRPKRALTIADPKNLNARAREFYERAILVNPGLVEAHVRLARQLELVGDFAKAATEVKKALALDPAVDVAFYAHLIGARAANALGQDDEAEANVQAALHLYPDASSAWMAASQTSLHRADPGTAIDRLTKLSEIPDSPSPAVRDPWSQYILGAGRLMDIAVAELWNLVPAYSGQ